MVQTGWGSALMQGLADSYFVIPYTLGNNLADDIRTASIYISSRI
jgi:succinate dehydrogenase / fumarate reductase flavoprotein subunit